MPFKEPTGPRFEPIPPGEQSGIKGEKIFGEFLKNTFPCIKISEKTANHDINDQHGGDYIWSVEGLDKKLHQVAVDVTGDTGPRAKEKIKRLMTNPYIALQRQGKKEEPIPRIVLAYNISFFLANQGKIESKEARRKAGLDIIKQILSQIEIISNGNTDYGRDIKPIKQSFEQEKIRLETAAKKEAA